jgi:hypothetical protein
VNDAIWALLSELDHSHDDEHWERLHTTVHQLFGWGNQTGILTANSSKQDFVFVCNFLEKFRSAEERAGTTDCLGVMLPRVERAIEIWYSIPFFLRG